MALSGGLALLCVVWFEALKVWQRPITWTQ